MILSRVKELETAIKTVEERSRRLAYVQGIQALAQKLTDRVNEVSDLLACRSALAERGCNLASSTAFAKVAEDALRAVQKRIDADAAAAADPGVFTATLSALNRVSTDLRNGLRMAWTAYAESRIPALNSDVLEVLRNIGELRPQVNRVEQRLRDLKERREGIPMRPEEVTAFDASVQEVESLWRTLGGDSLPNEVLRFLQESGTRGAVLDCLTPVVVEWLRGHGLWSAFRITVAREITGPGFRR